MPLETVSRLSESMRGRVAIAGGQVRVVDPEKIRGGWAGLLWEAAREGERVELRATARWILQSLAPQMGVELRIGDLGGVRGHSAFPGNIHHKISAPVRLAALRPLFRVSDDPGISRPDFDVEWDAVSASLSWVEGVCVSLAAALCEGFSGSLCFSPPDTALPLFRVVALRRHLPANEPVPPPGTTPRLQQSPSFPHALSGNPLFQDVGDSGFSVDLGMTPLCSTLREEMARAQGERTR